MFITRKHLSRRTLLKGAGVSLALPLLDAMIPAATALAQTAAARKVRAGFFYLPHGMIMDNTSHGAPMDRWTPAGSGADFKLNVITKSLEPYKKYVTSLGNIKNDAVSNLAPRGGAPRGGAAAPTTFGQHTINPATWLSGVLPVFGSPSPSMSATLDQVIADHFRQDTAMPSLQVASETMAQQAAGNAAVYTTLSFRDATTPMKMEHNPREIFIRLFGSEDRGEAAKQTASLLDSIKEQTRAMQRDLGPADRATLEGYLDSVRETEKQVEIIRKSDLLLKDTKLPPTPKGVMDQFDKQVDLIFELISLAYRADLTRVVSFSMAAEGTNQTYNHIGVSDSFHPVSHHANDLDRIDKLVRIQTWHMERFSNFLGRLAAMPDGEGTILDSAMFLYGSNMSNSDKHNSHPLPTLVIGGGGGTLSGGRHLALPLPTPITNVHLTLLSKVGVERKSFADSTGTIAL